MHIRDVTRAEFTEKLDKLRCATAQGDSPAVHYGNSFATKNGNDSAGRFFIPQPTLSLSLNRMMSRRWVLGLIAVGVSALLLSGCGGDRFPDYSYKMTIYAGGKAFSSVRRVEREETISIVDSSGRTVKRSLVGEAVIIDLNGRTYYALLSKPDNQDYSKFIVGAALVPAIPVPAEKPKTEQQQAIDEWKRDQSLGKEDYLADIAKRDQEMLAVKGAHPLPRTLPPRTGRPPFQAWPMFVTFDNPDNPKTVREISPEAIGVSKITIEITDEPVTTGIEKRLTWLPQYYDKMLNGSRLHNSNLLSNNLNNNAFILKESK